MDTRRAFLLCCTFWITEQASKGPEINDLPAVSGGTAADPVAKLDGVLPSFSSDIRC
jgi:hypothetical protein